MKTKSKTSQLRAEADRVFSLYIRKKYRNSLGVVNCVCDNDEAKLEYHHNTIHCAHYVTRGNDSVRWHEKNAGPMCEGCNYFNPKQKELLGAWLNQTHGEGTTDEMERLGRSTLKLLPFEIEEIIESYKLKLKEL